ncbi:hypothetical protein GJ744_007132 [Endocarpon pusillum]|uniref:Uncharacterized protein n=1 Tax=Endocarpon pusillum TaxID=364733 RepID=A0A8H7E6I2_9EURO|nr:hypothetical protein GJ744_007132 [Endocarpon pusillum]
MLALLRCQNTSDTLLFGATVQHHLLAAAASEAPLNLTMSSNEKVISSGTNPQPHTTSTAESAILISTSRKAR